MKLLIKHTDYAIRALMYLGQNRDRLVSSREIAGKGDIPVTFMRRILQILTREKIVVAKEGVTGGVCLAKEPKEITLAEIIRIFQGDIQLSECMFRKKICRNRARCVLRKRIQKIEEKITQDFKDISIAGLLTDLRK